MLASAGTNRQSGRMQPECEAMLVTGIYGSGKTSLVEEIADRYERLGVAFGAIDLDWLGWYHLPEVRRPVPAAGLCCQGRCRRAEHSFGSTVSPASGHARDPDRGC
jgi:Ni2+-binding GTPase involved in maturation of urease and hydrogenase